ncbi:hypothetical protein N9333_01120 [Gammaproteobacteria bacterium]|nr:hypothetical protein [Gammaproteobacteria bacterium]
MSTFITKQEQVNEDIKQIGIFLWVVTAFFSFQALFIDPYLLIDALLVALMAYYAYSKASIKAVYFGIGYYLLDTVLLLTVLDYSPHVLIIRCFILYWMINTAYKSYSLNTDSTELALES